MKCAKYNIGDISFPGFHIQIGSYMTAHIRNFYTLHTISTNEAVISTSSIQNTPLSFPSCNTP